MKRKNIFGLLFLIVFMLSPSIAYCGQGNENGGPPPWAPANGYRAKTRHIYFPEYNFYFDVQKNVYIYLAEDKWQISVDLPMFYAEINLRNSITVELELDTDKPQQFNAEHKAKYKTKGNNHKL